MNLNLLKKILYEQYQLSATELIEQMGGWASLAFRIKTTKGKKYFLKIYEIERSSTEKLTEFIDDYLPVVDWLNLHSSLKGKIIDSTKTRYGNNKYEDEKYIYLLFDFIEGNTIGKDKLSANQVFDLASIVSELHSFSTNLPFDLQRITETYDVNFAIELQKVLLKHHWLKNDLKNILAENKRILLSKIDDLLRLSETLSNQELQFVLCHTDIHHWNMIQTAQSLVLLDWEGLKLSPREADLCLIQSQPYFDSFFDLYKHKHDDYSINEESMAFYKLRRRLEDIWEFVEQLEFDNLSDLEKTTNFNHLKNEINWIKNSPNN